MAVHETTRLATERYYSDYEARRGPTRNDILHNPEVLFQVLAAEASLISALRLIGPDRAHTKVLDVGCGDGSSLLPLLRLGFEPSNLYGVDIRGGRIRGGASKVPGVGLSVCGCKQFELSRRNVRYRPRIDDLPPDSGRRFLDL